MIARTKDGKSMKRSFTARCMVAAAALVGALVAAPTDAKAQEIQLTGPLAGAPSVRKLRQYKDGRFEVAIGPGFTLLDEYKRTIFLSGKLQYNLTDWFGFGVFGGFAPDALSLNTDLADKIDDTPAPRNSRTAVNLPGKVGSPAFGDQAGKMSWIATPQIVFTPFRGKLALFQKLFIDTDLYFHGGVAFVGVKERADCGGGGGQLACTDQRSFVQDSRVAVAPSFGLGFSLYPSDFISISLEYRAFPFQYNRGGFDSRGAGPDGAFPDNKIDSADQTFKFNQMFFIAAGFYLPTKPKVSD